MGVEGVVARTSLSKEEPRRPWDGEAPPARQIMQPQAPVRNPGQNHAPPQCRATHHHGPVDRLGHGGPESGGGRRAVVDDEGRLTQVGAHQRGVDERDEAGLRLGGSKGWGLWFGRGRHGARAHQFG